MSNETDPRIQQTLDEIQARFETRLSEIKKSGAEKINEVTDDSPDPNSVEATVNMTFDVQFKTTSIKFDVPTFRMETQKLVFDLPTVTMSLKSISWDVPATRMERRCIAKKPVITCNWKGCKTEMKCMYMDFPEVYMKRMEIKMDYPEFSMKRQELSFDKPMITFETVEIKLDLPQFHLRDLSGDLREQEADLTEIGREMETQVALAQKEMDAALVTGVGDQIEVIFDEIRQQLTDERAGISKQFDDAIAKMKSTIKTLKENNATDEVPKLEGELAKLVEDYKTVLDEIDASIKQLNDEQLKVINSIGVE